MLGTTAKKKLSLPHQHPPDSYYEIKINDNDPVVGPNPVKPEFGQPGGGIEFIFPNGTPPGPVTGPFPIN